MPERRKNKLFYRVMVVDDDADIRVMLKAIFEKSWAFEVLWEASNAMESLELLQTQRSQVRAPVADVILLDFLMPGMSGKEAFPLIKALAPQAKVILLTVVPERCDEVPDHDGCVDKSLLPSDMVFALYKCLNPESTLTKEEVNAYR